MATLDPFVDGEQLRFSRLNEALSADRFGTDQQEPVDQFLQESGAFGPAAERGAAVMSALASFGDFLAELRYDALDDRWATDEDTLLNFAFKNGHHYVEADRARRGVVALPLPRSHVRRKIQKFEPWFRAQHGQLSKQTPQAQVVPKHRTQDDRDAASFAEECREWIEPMAYSFQQRSITAMWQLLGGVTTYYVDTHWERDEEYLEQTGMMHKPELVFEPLSPMEVWNANRHSCIKDMRWFGRDRFMPIAEARALYLDPSVQRHLVRESEVTDPSEHGFWTLRRIQNLTGREDPWGRDVTRGNATKVSRADQEEEVIVAEFWGRKNLVLMGTYFADLELLDQPNLTVEVLQRSEETGEEDLVRFPNGLRVRFTPEGHVLEIADNHTPGGALPFREAKLTQAAGFWPMAWATPLREINQAINWLISLREEHTLRTADPIFLEPVESRVDRRATASGSTTRIKYRANRFNMKPEWANPPTWPSDSVQYMQELNEIWMEISGRREVSQGTLPARISGVAVSLLQEADQAQLSFAGAELESCYADVIRMGLLNIQAFFPENDPRLAKLAGDAPYKLVAFMTANLDDALDIKVQEGSGVPRQASLIKQTAMELFQMGGLVDEVTGQPDWRRLMKVFEFATEDELYAEEELDRQNANDEEEFILSLDPLMAMMLLQEAAATAELPPPLDVNPFDNHVVHERSHRMRLKKIEGDQSIPEPNKQLLELHWQITVMGALPILINTDPSVVAPFLGGPGAGGPEGGSEEGEGGGGSDGGDDE